MSGIEKPCHLNKGLAMSLIEAAQLKQSLDTHEDFLLFDCRFDLSNSDLGRASYLEGHIPSAVYVHVDQDLSSEKNGQNGRHPLPSIEQWQKTCQSLGIEANRKIILYDNQSGMYAVRMWWMLRATGHQNILILNGGFAAWVAAGFPVEQTDNPRVATTLNHPLAKTYAHVFSAKDILSNLSSKTYSILDARSPDRFRGENETLDPVGGHIPGALNRFFKDNLGPDGKFKSADALKKEFKAIIGDIPSEKIIHQCGSGITACHNMFAMELAGLQSYAIYPGSWSEWCADSTRPIEK